MNATVSHVPSVPAAPRPKISNPPAGWGPTLAMLPLRLAGFAFFQALIAGLYALSGTASPWQASIAWWPVTVTLTNFFCIGIQVVLFRREGARWLDLFRFQRPTLGRDLLVCLGLGVILGPLGMLPAQVFADLLLGGLDKAYGLFFHPIAPWAAALALALFPLTIALAELPHYFGYVMPRLEALSGSRGLAVLVPVLFLAAQHATMPLIFDGNFMLWRFLMFLPFALALGVILRWRPRLLPYLIVIHGLLDLGTIWFVFAKSFGIG